MREEQRARGGVAAAIEGALVVFAGIADGSYAQGQFLQAGEIVADVHMAVPESGNQGAAGAVDDAGGGGDGDLGARADGDDLAVVDDDGLVGEEARGAGIEEANAAEGHGLLRHGHQTLDESGRLSGQSPGLRFLNFGLLAGV